MYYKSIGCIPFRCLYGRDPWVSALMAPALRAMVEPLPNTEVFEAKDEDLDNNKEVLGLLLNKNNNRWQAAEQERKDEDNQFLSFSATTNKDYNISSNLGDFNNQILTTGKSLAKEN